MLRPFSEEPLADRIIVALDCDARQALDLAEKLQGHVKWLKVGMTLYYAQGPSIVKQLKAMGFNVFLDLKFHDIPHQVRGAAASATESGADMITMHAVGAQPMLEAGRQGAQNAAEQAGLPEPITLAITVLTSMDQACLNSVGVERNVQDQVCALARIAMNAELSGVVASAQEAALLRSLLGPKAYIVTPGVRPAGSDSGDQNRIATPDQAFAAGASHLVIGRPITQAADPVAAFQAIVDSL